MEDTIVRPNTQKSRGEAAWADLDVNTSVHRVDLHTLNELRSVFEKLENWMRVYGYSGRDLFAARLALAEAAINGFTHGNLGNPRKTVRIDYLVTANEVIMAVKDEGAGFDPNLVPLAVVPGKRRTRSQGLFLMHMYMSDVNFNPKGNRVLLYLVRSVNP
jgi:anti-sigma regulatory factor (Ser/Thr protein kinase)